MKTLLSSFIIFSRKLPRPIYLSTITSFFVMLIWAPANSQQWTQNDPNNIAAFKPTRQSSQFEHGNANRAVDGNTNGNWGASSVTHTNNENNPWWEVNLLDEYDINTITLFNRSDCCPERLNNFSIIVANREGGNGTVFNTENSTFTGSKSYRGSARGQYVRIQFNKPGIISLTEVVVNGVLVAKRQQSNDNLALGKPTRQSSVINGRSSNLANDGNLEGNVNLGSVATTNNDSRPFWEVDLGSTYLIDRVVIAKRTDGNQNGLKDFNIWVTQDIRNDNRNTEPFIEQTLHLEKNIQSFDGATKRPGRFVRIQMNGTGHLELGEVQVFGSEIGEMDVNLPDQSRFVYSVTKYSNLTNSEIPINQQLAKTITEGFSFSKSTEEVDNKYWEVSASAKASIQIFMANIEVSVGARGGGSSTTTDVSSQSSNLSESQTITVSDNITVRPNTTIYKVVKFKIVEKPFVYTFNGKQYKFNKILDRSTSVNSTEVLEYDNNFDPGFVFDDDNRISQANFDKIMAAYPYQRAGSNNNQQLSQNPTQQTVSSGTNNTNNNTISNNNNEEFAELNFYPSEGITLDAAMRIAAQNGWELATAEDIQEEWEYGYHMEKCGLIADGRIVAPVQQETEMLYRGSNIGLDTEIVNGFFYYRN